MVETVKSVVLWQGFTCQIHHVKRDIISTSFVEGENSCREEQETLSPLQRFTAGVDPPSFYTCINLLL